jgi:DNA-binding transcriptional LysR family regulator
MDGLQLQPSASTNLLHLDLNLLIALDALLQERSVTLAAERVQRSQPALSASLKRLRHQFQDDLLIRVGNKHELTPLGVQLKSRLSVLLAEVERLFDSRSRFDAERATRQFVLGASDYGQQLLGRAIAAELTECAPNVRLRFEQMSDESVANPEDQIRNTDGYIFPLGLLEELPHIETYHDRWVLMVDADNPVVGDKLTLDQLSKLEWVSAFHRQGSMVPAVRQLQLLGIHVNVAVATEGFAPIPSFIQGTERIAMIQEGLARQLADPGRFRLLKCPFDVVPLIECFWWHPSLTHDPSHVWFRSVVARAGTRLAKELSDGDITAG